MVATTHFNTTLGHIVVTAEIDSTAVRGDGGVEYPRLIVPIKLKVLPLKDPGRGGQDLLLLNFNAQLFVEGRNSKIADSTQKSFQVLVEGYELEPRLDLEFVLDRFRVERIEQLRKKDISFRLDFQLAFGTFGPPTRYQHQPSKTGPASAERISNLGVLEANLNLTVPQSIWVDRILLGLGFGVIQLLEIPVISLEQCQALQHSWQALKRADEQFRLGDYDEAVGLCRTAVDPIRNKLKKLKEAQPDSLATDCVEKYGTATLDWLITILGKTHGVANTPHHSPHTGHFNRFDAQMILTIVSNVIAYVARFDLATDVKSD